MLTERARAPLSLSFPGAGILVFWQLGVLHGLSQMYDLTRAPLLGSSSGAVATALAASGACLKTAAQRGTELFSELNIASRPFGLVGVLGKLVGRWLHDTLPQDAAVRCRQNGATLLVTTLPLLRTQPISDFSSRADLIRVILASAHIPVVLDWRMFVRVRGHACIDGGLWWLLQRSLQEYQNHAARQTLLIKPCDDPGLAHLCSRRHNILAQPGEAGGQQAQEMWERGLAYALRLSEVHGSALEHLALTDRLLHCAAGHTSADALHGRLGSGHAASHVADSRGASYGYVAEAPSGVHGIHSLHAAGDGLRVSQGVVGTSIADGMLQGVGHMADAGHDMQHMRRYHPQDSQQGPESGGNQGKDGRC